MDTIPARRGKAAYLKQGQAIRIVNTHGAQVVDTGFHRRHAHRIHVHGAYARHADQNGAEGGGWALHQPAAARS
jgi:uncharacterized protein YcgI (DUF1989 family)